MHEDAVSCAIVDSVNPSPRLLGEAGLDVRFAPFSGPHTIPADAIEQAALSLVALAVPTP